MPKVPQLCIEVVRLVRDAHGARCLDCPVYFDHATNSAVPWSWRQSQAMHERGSRHRMELVRLALAEDRS